LPPRPENQWKRLTVAEGEKGPRTYAWACQRVVESRDSLPGPDTGLLARRLVTDPLDIAYYLSNAPVETPLLKLAQVASTRYTVVHPSLGNLLEHPLYGMIHSRLVKGSDWKIPLMLTQWVYLPLILRHHYL
jgi:hypothetical protein